MTLVSPVDSRCPADLAAAIRGAIAHHAYWRETAELVAEELRNAQRALGEITGAGTADELLGRIFASFCIGK